MPIFLHKSGLRNFKWHVYRVFFMCFEPTGKFLLDLIIFIGIFGRPRWSVVKMSQGILVLLTKGLVFGKCASPYQANQIKDNNREMSNKIEFELVFLRSIISIMFSIYKNNPIVFSYCYMKFRKLKNMHFVELRIF